MNFFKIRFKRRISLAVSEVIGDLVAQIFVKGGT